MEKKSKAIFFLLAVAAILSLVLFSVFLAESMWILSVLTLVLFIGIFGVGFTLKKKYRENNWL